ncbi:MAG: methyltransferase domain-containing protein [Haloquadratum sp.]|nr:methyltransferase domain-containing protein [Haloferacaceae archaeon]MDR9445534.1 methyltransferase domain-containing protein [Haloquadratum sp.]
MYHLEFAGTDADDPLALLEAAAVCTDLTRLAPGLASAASVVPERMSELAFTRVCCRHLGTVAPAVDAAVALVRERPIDRTGSVAVRAHRIREHSTADTAAIERAVGAVLTERGHTIDLDAPTHTLRVSCGADRWMLGWVIASRAGGYGSRQPARRPFFSPGSIDPIEARAAVNIAIGQRPGVVCDPLCGTGGFLIEAAAMGAQVIGGDIRPQMVAGAHENLTALAPVAPLGIYHGDASAIPLAGQSVDAVVTDVPYGRQSPIGAATQRALVAAVLPELARITSRVVLICDRRLEAPAGALGLQAHITRRVHRSLTRHLHLFTTAR